KLIGIFDHQVTVERQFSSFAQRSHDRRANGKIRQKVSVHDIDVDHRTAALGCAADLLRKAGEVRRQNRGCELNQPGLSREGYLWKFYHASRKRGRSQARPSGVQPTLRAT